MIDMRNMKRVISLLLAVVLAVGTFAGCGQSSRDEPPITATAVKFSKSGQYTTTVSSEKVDLSGMTAGNVEVRYSDPTVAFTEEYPVYEAEAPIAEETATANEATTASEAENTSYQALYPLTARVDSVNANDKGGYDITFTDENAAEYATGNYMITFDATEEIADVKVDFPEITLTPDLDFVTPSQNDIKLTLTIEGSEFEDDISIKDISLGDSFDKMDREIISSSANNLTLHLKGTVLKNAAGAYQWGTVSVKPSAIKDGYANVSAKTNIQLDTVYFDTAALKYENGKITADLKVYGVADVDALTKDNVKIDGVTTDAVEKVDDNTVKITFSADKINSVNDFSDLVSGKDFTVGDYANQLGLSQAGIYPVFDYVEEDGDHLTLTLIIYASGGTFDKGLKADAFSFADDFEGAKAESVKVDDETTATLIITVPANGANAENVNFNGTVTLAAGSLTNEWGEKTSVGSSNTRKYSNESMGREISLNGDTLLEIQKYTRGLNTVFGSVCYYGSFASKVYSIGKTILEATGVLQSDQAKLMEQFSILNDKIDGIIKTQAQIMTMLDQVNTNITETANDRYRENLNDLKADVELLEDLFWNGAMYMALEKAKDDGKLEKMPRQDEFENYKAYLPDVKNMTDDDLEAYNNELMDFLEKECRASNTLFNDFLSAYDDLKKDLGHVADKLAAEDSTNPITRYDTLCAYKYNFDSQCYEFRSAQRDTALDLMTRGMMIVFAREKVMTNSKDPTFINLQKRVEAACKWIESSYAYIGHSASEIKAFPRKEYVNTGATYIGDIAVSGDPNSSNAKDALRKKGYTVYDVDLNRNAGGDYIYLGYKTTKNYNEAIKSIFVEVRAFLDPNPVSRTKASLCPVYGSAEFVEDYGDLNHDAGGNYLYLHQDRTAGDVYKNRAITNIWIDGSVPQNGEGSTTDLNYNAGGDYLYLHTAYAFDKEETGAILENDPEYYPYSYVLGKKVAMGYAEYDKSYGGIRNTDGSFRSWTDNEYNTFIKRLINGTWDAELKGAGFSNTTNELLITANQDGVPKGTFVVSGSNEKRNDYFDYFWGTHKNITHLKLYDYTPNVIVREKPEKVDIDFTLPSPNMIKPRGVRIDTITIDVWDRCVSVEDLGDTFQQRTYGTLRYLRSSNYAIDAKGRVGQYVADNARSWYTGNSGNDNRAMTIVVAPSSDSGREITEASYNKLVDLVAYICDQNGIKQLVWSDDKNARVNHQDGANITLLRDFNSNTDAPGSYMYGRMQAFANDVNKRLDYTS